MRIGKLGFGRNAAGADETLKVESNNRMHLKEFPGVRLNDIAYVPTLTSLDWVPHFTLDEGCISRSYELRRFTASPFPSLE
jgi:hypothetical protein